MPLINSNTLKKSVSKQNIVHEYDDNAPLALVSILINYLYILIKNNNSK